jgi:2-amino-4-hydroxy-6-hydroxymethyldihydropteridine diphosphokinase
MKGIYLLLGSNLGDRMAILRKARYMIQDQIGEVVNRSSVYATEAWGVRDQPEFFNQVLEVDCDLEPVSLLDRVLLIEKQLGRERIAKWGERIIDIDILYYRDQIIQSRRLTIPHPHIPSRRFALVPLTEIAPSLIHPVLKKDQTALLAACKDDLGVLKVNEGETSAKEPDDG